MTFITIGDLPADRDELRKCAVAVTPIAWVFDDCSECYRRLVLDVEPIVVATDKWPLAARIIAKLATADDRGVGDTLTRCFAAARLDRIVKRLMPKGCGCVARAAYLNFLFPFAPVLHTLPAPRPA